MTIFRPVLSSRDNACFNSFFTHLEATDSGDRTTATNSQLSSASPIFPCIESPGVSCHSSSQGITSNLERSSASCLTKSLSADVWHRKIRWDGNVGLLIFVRSALNLLSLCGSRITTTAPHDRKTKQKPAVDPSRRTCRAQSAIRPTSERHQSTQLARATALASALRAFFVATLISSVVVQCVMLEWPRRPPLPPSTFTLRVR
jgi:hypothetical protein